MKSGAKVMHSSHFSIGKHISQYFFNFPGKFLMVDSLIFLLIAISE